MEYKYFAFIDGEEKGPFQLSQLSEAGVRPSTYVWCKGMSDWQRADTVDEIKDYFRGKVSSPSNTTEPIIIDPSMPKGENKENLSKDPMTEKRPRFSRFGISEEDAPEPEPDLNVPPQVSMALAVCSLIFFPPGAIAAIYFTQKARKYWNESNTSNANPEDMTNKRRQAYDYARMAKMWIGLSFAFGLIFWTLLFSL